MVMPENADSISEIHANNQTTWLPSNQAPLRHSVPSRPFQINPPLLISGGRHKTGPLSRANKVGEIVEKVGKRLQEIGASPATLQALYKALPQLLTLHIYTFGTPVHPSNKMYYMGHNKRGCAPKP
ncbi:uncharacterized protein YALI1_E16249g [Yarrowia lipolytica]|uniref:Uncharacterized protein n=1 Tax=Yarrowia lipolytica TaxID=4952 RepID=A0A1D8NIB0_YARLL|nr:hypothetical protein YALI1_E16249g [Yarrowia lipolytica]